MKIGLFSALLLLGLAAAAQAAAPTGDLNLDYQVDRTDLVLFASEWLAGPNSPADFNHDGQVDVTDLAGLANNWGRIECPVVINELLAHSHDEAPDWIELSNPSSISVCLGGWVLSDDANDPNKFRFPPETVIEPNSYLVLYEDVTFADPNYPGTLSPFKMSENGEGLYLFSGDDPTYPDYAASEVFGASETWISFGRYVKSTGAYAFVHMSEPTPGAANAYPLVGPVVINEVMYHPSIDGDAEYVELLNISGMTISLYDFESSEPWRFTDGAGLDLKFPSNPPVTLSPGEHLLLARDASLVRAVYYVPPTTRIIGWDSGRLSNGNEQLRLLKPGDTGNGTRYWIEVDRLDYSDGSHAENFDDHVDPWPCEADGDGLSLNRLAPLAYGNDPNTWTAAVPSPGSAND